MARQKRAGRPFQVYLDDDLRAQLEVVASANRRSVSVEVRVAIERYLASPDVIGPAAPSAPAPEPAPEAPPVKPTKRKKSPKEEGQP